MVIGRPLGLSLPARPNRVFDFLPGDAPLLPRTATDVAAASGAALHGQGIMEADHSHGPWRAEALRIAHHERNLARSIQSLTKPQPRARGPLRRRGRGGCTDRTHGKRLFG